MSNSRFDLADRVVIITGAGAGIGKVYASELARAGARVVVADIEQEAANAVAEVINGNGGKAVAARADVTSESHMAHMADVAMHAFGRIDALVNNAALMSTLARRPWHEIPVDEWDRVMQVNLRGMFLACRAVYPQMKKQQSGSIVNISSSRVFEGTPNRLHYTTSKAGVVGFTRALAREVGPDSIRVNCIAPGLTLSETQVKSSKPEYLAETAKGRAIARPQLPDDLIGTLMYLVSDASVYLTGQTINVDGGKAMH